MTIPETRSEATPRWREAARRHELLAAGALAGLLAGTAMMAVAIAAAAWHGIAPLRPLQLIGETFVGPGALQGAAKVAFGVGVHALVSAFLGVVFASIAPRELAPFAAVGQGEGFALFVMGVMMTIVVPWVNPGFRDGIQVMGGSFALALGVFGVVIGVAPALRRRLSGEATDAPDTARGLGAAPAAGRARTT